MAGTSNFPSSLDDNTTLNENLTDGVSGDDVLAAHPNNLANAIKAVEAKVGIDNSGVNTSIDNLMRNVLGWTPGASNDIDLAGTLDVTGAVVLDSTMSVTGAATFVSTISVGGTPGVGSSGQVMTSQGAGTPPEWLTSTGRPPVFQQVFSS